MNLKYLPIEFDAKAVKDDGAFEGYASTFGNVDAGMDVVLPGAFVKSLDARPAGQIKMLWQHDPSKPIGKWLAASEDSKGLFVKGKLLTGLPLAQEVHLLAKEGIIDSLSIGYRTIDADFTQGGVRQLKQVALHEISLVTFPMNDKATLTGVKDFNPRELEASLRDAGLSRGDAVKAVAIFRETLRDAGQAPVSEPRDAGRAAQAAAIAAMRGLAERLRA